MAEEPKIGELRWPVQICERLQAPAEDGSVAESLRPVLAVRARIEPIGAMTFWAAQQTDTPVTHRVTIRWTDTLTPRHVILRSTMLRDGSTREERFRVRRIKEVSGRQRWMLIEAELEMRQ